MTKLLASRRLHAAMALCFVAGFAQSAAAQPTADAPGVSYAAAPAPAAAVAPDAPGQTWWVAGELHASLLSNLIDQSTINISFGYAAKAGFRWHKQWGAYLQLEQNLWVETEIETNVVQGALNIGLGIEHLYFGERVRFAIAAGPSILLFDTALDDPGTTGMFVDIRPVGLRWPVGRRFVLVLDPLAFTLVMPNLSGIPLIQIQYRTTFGFEFDLGV